MNWDLLPIETVEVYFISLKGENFTQQRDINTPLMDYIETFVGRVPKSSRLQGWEGADALMFHESPSDVVRFERVPGTTIYFELPPAKPRRKKKRAR